MSDGTSKEVFQFACHDPVVLEVPVDMAGRYNSKGKPIEINKFSMGALTGFEIALAVLRSENPWFQDFTRGDIVRITCTGVKESDKIGFSDMPEFLIELNPSPSSEQVNNAALKQ